LARQDQLLARGDQREMFPGVLIFLPIDWDQENVNVSVYGWGMRQREVKNLACGMRADI
jgi:hypothetical protein